jgi:KaiC/GvpD/RAD55 family RecA-like ATPase
LRPELYYYIFSYLISYIFSVSFYARFVIGYPALLQPKWKALMPFDIVKVATTVTPAFLAISLYFTVKESPSFILYQNVAYVPLIIFLLVISATAVLILAQIKTISGKSKLKYWSHLKAGLFIHLAATLYVFGLIALLWGDLSSKGRLFSTLFGFFAFAFYVFYALDMYKVITCLKIKLALNKIDATQDAVSLCSIFFIIFFGISFTYGKTSGVLSSLSLESSPAILFFIAFFLVAFTLYLRVTHRGFEELMRKNVWSELSYLSGLAIFVLVYFIYTSANLEHFPLRDMVFLGYFAVLLIEIASIRTLRFEQYVKPEERIEDLLNYHTSTYLRADYLEENWERVTEKYDAAGVLQNVGFNPSSRTFDLSGADEGTRATIAVAMLLGMYQVPELNKITPVKRSYEEIRKEIEGVLKEKVLTLPEELRASFDETKCYAMLFERTMNNIIEGVKTFIPAAEHVAVFKKFSRIDAFFGKFIFEDSRIKIPEEIRLSREDFVRYFKIYLDSLEESFPFEYVLLYEPIKEEIRRRLSLYNFSIEDLLDIVPTGVKRIDEVCDGGLIKKTTTLMLAEETKSKNEILSSFILQGIRDRDGNIYATSREPAQEICSSLAKNVALERVVVIDLYQAFHTASTISGIAEEECRITISANLTLFQHAIVKEVRKYPREMHKRVVLDVYNDLLKYYKWEELFPILCKQLEGFRKWNCTCIIALDPSLISESKLEELKKQFDNVFILSGRGKQALMRTAKLFGGAPKQNIISIA